MPRRPSQSLLVFQKFALSHWRRSPRTTLLLVAIVALGVAVFLSIRLANRAAISGFSMFTESLAGESDLVLRPAAGRLLPESLLPAIREELDPLPAFIFPVLEANAKELGEEGNELSAIPPLEGQPPGLTSSGQTTSYSRSGQGGSLTLQGAPNRPLEESVTPMNFRLIGVDLVALRNAVAFRKNRRANEQRGKSESDANGSIGAALGEDSGVFISATFSKARGLATGDTLRFAMNGMARELGITGILEDDPLRPAVPENILVIDLPRLQGLLPAHGAISRIEIRIPPGRDSTENLRVVGERLRNAAGDRWIVETPKARDETAAQMTQAFRMNLTILSTLALLVGTYLILQALEAAVVRRRPEIAILRSLGVEPGPIARAWLLESLALGVTGSLLGIALGAFLARFSVGSIARTVDALYFETTAEAASLAPSEAGFALAFGVVASLAAGWLPSRDAALTPPAQALRAGSRSRGIRLLDHPLAGLAFLGVGAALAFLPPLTVAGSNRVPLGGYLSALAWLIGLGILASLLFRPLSAWIGGRRERCERVYAASQLRRPSGRHRLAAAGLLAAIGMASGMGILVHSFEGTLTGWIGNVLRADLYVSAGAQGRPNDTNRILSETWWKLATDPGLDGYDVIRDHPVRFQGRDVRLAGVSYHTEAGYGLKMTWLQAPADARLGALERAIDGEPVPVWVNEAFSRRFRRGTGDAIAIATPAGSMPLRIEGVYADYSDEAGTILVGRRHSAAWFSDNAVSTLAAYVKEGVNPEDVRARWAEAFPALSIRENRRLRSEALRVFRQTFSVTYALEGIAVFVAVAGLGLALASLLLERQSEMTTLKLLGFSRRRLAVASMWEGAALAVTGIAGGILLGLVLGAILIYVINRQSFGWTLDYRAPLGLFAWLSLLTLATSAAVSAAVGYWGGRLRAEQEE